ncbi:hypothetical protein P153DRAFT_332496 [Dothidotthia symphoricarpi CBS 119687]|uniref:N-acetyltransferase domain-containing protein n=1 Tax=Dothidotthia symphoricarpi CBS 119687 TaxID=1392245 RepID=A0A6A6AQU5_9PLEO|nr:uncharacterized protein P153DRAFT_332496 [Dothidotthia symphoricarpi CBS 119687]KAF2133573.1 hypothetical protein P153DRAFT_332496 [Dothidotthia symphoricarpi CBS 119687]
MSQEPATTPSFPDAPITQFRLRRAGLFDLSSIARVWCSGFFDDEIIGDIMHPHRQQHPKDVYWFLLRGIRERFWNWRHQFIVVTTDDGNGREIMVGAADWRRLGFGGRARELWRVDPRNLISPLLRMYHNLSLRLFPNRAANPSRSSFLDTAVKESEKYWTGNRAECWDLHVCGVHPDFQAKGAGKLLAQWGVQKAKEEGDGVCASVLCGEKNRGFYGKAGLGVQVGGSEGKEGGIALFTR